MVVSPQGKLHQLYSESHALLISASSYRDAHWSKLDSTEKEVNQLSTALRDQGFDVVRVSNPTGQELRTAIREFFSSYGRTPDSRLLFFFAGHGYTDPLNDIAYLVPVDAIHPIASQRDFQIAAMQIAELELVAREIISRHAIFIFDSCFSGAIFTTRGAKSSVENIDHTDEGRWRFLTQRAARPVRQFLSAGGAKEELPSKSIFLPLLLQGLQGDASALQDGYVTGKELGIYLEQTVPRFARNQSPQSGVIRVPELASGDIVFQYAKAHNSAGTQLSVTTMAPQAAQLPRPDLAVPFASSSPADGTSITYPLNAHETTQCLTYNATTGKFRNHCPFSLIVNWCYSTPPEHSGWRFLDNSCEAGRTFQTPLIQQGDEFPFFAFRRPHNEKENLEAPLRVLGGTALQEVVKR